MRQRPVIVYLFYLLAILLALPGLGILFVVGAAWRARGIANLNAGDLATALVPLSIAFGMIMLALLLWALAAIIRELRAIRASAAAPPRAAFTPLHPAGPSMAESPPVARASAGVDRAEPALDRLAAQGQGANRA